MLQGDKYIHFTNYLKKCHEQGQDELTLSFTEIERIWDFLLPDLCGSIAGQMTVRKVTR